MPLASRRRSACALERWLGRASPVDAESAVRPGQATNRYFWMSPPGRSVLGNPVRSVDASCFSRGVLSEPARSAPGPRSSVASM